MRKVLKIGAGLAASLGVASVSVAEVNFSDTRRAVADGEYYLLEDYGDWKAWCIRDEQGEDTCEASTEIKDLKAGLVLDFSVLPYAYPMKASDADVDIAPRALLTIAPLSEAKHYADYSAAITSIDEWPFDAYWCKLTEPDDCNRGPELSHSDLAAMLAGRTATVTVYDRDDTPEDYAEKTKIEVDLDSFRRAFDHAKRFGDAILGIDTENGVFPTNVCTIRIDGADKRISYTFDKDFEAANTTFREILRGPRGEGTCPSYVALAYLTPDMTIAQRELFCLVYDEKGSLSGFQQGTRDAYRVCKAPTRSFCERVNNSKEAAIAVTGLATGAVGSAVGTTAVTGTSVVLHSSGAAILTGSAGYIAGTLGTIGTVALGVLTAPLTVTAAAVSVVAVGGAVYVCSE